MRGVAAHLDRRLRLPDVARRLPSGRARRCWRGARRAGKISRAWRLRSRMTAWICCRRRIRGPASRWRYGTCSVRLAASRSGGCWATRRRTRRRRTPRSSSATPRQQTMAGARAARASGFRAVKFGWGPIGRGTAAADAEHFHAAREGMGADGILLVDAGQVWGEDVEAAAARLPALEAAGRSVAGGAVPRERTGLMQGAGRAQWPGQAGRRRRRAQCVRWPST